MVSIPARFLDRSAPIPGLSTKLKQYRYSNLGSSRKSSAMLGIGRRIASRISRFDRNMGATASYNPCSCYPAGSYYAESSCFCPPGTWCNIYGAMPICNLY